MKQPNNLQPPRWPLIFFRWYCHPDYQEDLEGDLLERFERRLATEGRKKARWEFSKDVIRLFKPGIIRSFNPTQPLHHTAMFKNHLKIAWRNLIKQRLHSIINITGLAVGIASFLLIALYVHNELSYDRFHENANNIYRVVLDVSTESEMIYGSTTPLSMGPTFTRDYSEVLDFVRIKQGRILISHGNIHFYEDQCLWADSSIFRVFNFPLLEGDPKTALTEPKTVVLTESTARKYFGEESPVGQSLELHGQPFRVTGVAVDVPANSHFAFDILFSLVTTTSRRPDLEKDRWFSPAVHTYLLLAEGEDKVNKLRAAIPEFITRYTGEGGQGIRYTDLPLQPLTSIYLSSPRQFENGKRGSMSNLYILSIIALFILLIASFNYVNLAIARASRRIKEVGLRKIMGAERSLLIQQFLGESIIVSFLSMLLGLGIALLVLPLFNSLLNTSLDFVMMNEWYIWVGLLAFSILLGVLSGTYPAFLISGFHPLRIFQQSPQSLQSQIWLRKMLVTAQFAISMVLVAGTLLVFEQLDLLSNAKLGFDKEQILKIDFNRDKAIQQHLEAVKQTLGDIPGVTAVSTSFHVPGDESIPIQFASIETAEGKMVSTNFNTYFVDEDFIPNYGIEVVAGRAFSHDFPSDDSAAFMVNEAAIKQFGFLSPEVALGRKVEQGGKKGRIIGVVKDFQYKSLYHEVKPLLLHINRNRLGTLSVKLASDNIPAIVADIEKQWKTLAPHLPFQYSFLDQDYDYLYRAEKQLSKVVSIFSSLAIFVACLGLLGLTVFSVERRFKEIGIRKVLGASVSSVVFLMSKEFVRLIIIALFLAIPITYFVISGWLENFSQRITISPFAFAVAGGAILIVAWTIISFISIKAAQSNPVDSLRNE